MVDAAIEQSFFVFRFHLVHLAHQLNEIVPLLIIVFIGKCCFPGVQFFTMLKEHHNSTGFIRRGDVVAIVRKVVIRKKTISVHYRLAIRVPPPEWCLCYHETLLGI